MDTLRFEECVCVCVCGSDLPIAVFNPEPFILDHKFFAELFSGLQMLGYNFDANAFWYFSFHEILDNICIKYRT